MLVRVASGTDAGGTDGRNEAGAQLLGVGVLHLLEEGVDDGRSGDGVGSVYGHGTKDMAVCKEDALLRVKDWVPWLLEVLRQVLQTYHKVDALGHLRTHGTVRQGYLGTVGGQKRRDHVRHQRHV